MRMNLIVCMTPFQVLVAEKIIDLYPNDNFFVIMQCRSKNNKKYQHYFNRLKDKVKRAEYREVNGKLGILLDLIKNFKFYFMDINKVFISSIDNIFVHSILSILETSQIYTFDDGTANIDKTSFYANDQILSKKIFFIRAMLGIKINTNDIKQLSKRHYTIYKNIPNITVSSDKLEYISLFDSDITVKEPTKTVKIFLGQPIFEGIINGLGSQNQKSVSTIKKAINFCEAEFYLPHPRESYFIPNIKYITTELILEDYLINEIQVNTDTKYEIYTFFSSAILNVKDVPNVEVFSLVSEDIPTRWSGMYSLLEENNIQIRKF